MTMPTKSHLGETPKEDGSTAETLFVEFTNGSLEQLRDLAKFFKTSNDDPYEVIQLGIGLLQRVKEENQKIKNKTPKKDSDSE